MNSKSTPSSSSKNTGKQALVSPLLRDVGKLAAGVASVNTNSGGSATGSLRNKYALEPGHSLMDWIRLGASYKDLTGVGSQAGRLPVTISDLAKHKTKTDAWLAIRGRVYNVTSYLPFHPGGPDELMRAAGTDATSLFEDVHPWVNFEQILKKCYIGPLTAPNVEDVFGLNPEPKQVQTKQANNNNATPKTANDSERKTTISPPPKDVNSASSSAKQNVLPKFDWIQKLDSITLIFYTGPFSNPQIEINQLAKDLINITLQYNGNLYENEMKLNREIEWPCQIKTAAESGKIEFVFGKSQSEIWENYGVLKQTSKQQGSLVQAKLLCTITNKVQVNHNTFLLELARQDKSRMVVPIGKHVKVFDTIQGEQVSRSYTPVPHCLFTQFGHQQTLNSASPICLLVKRYPDGNLSRLLSDTQIGQLVTISRPMGPFNLMELERRETFILLAAGTGITPIFSIMFFLLERRIRKCQQLTLVFCNRGEADILFREQFEQLASNERRFRIVNVLSQPGEAWQGPKGHISKQLVEETLQRHLSGTTYTKQDVYWMACGPTAFTNLSKEILDSLSVGSGQMHLFAG